MRHPEKKCFLILFNQYWITMIRCYKNSLKITLLNLLDTHGICQILTLKCYQLSLNLIEIKVILESLLKTGLWNKSRRFVLKSSEHNTRYYKIDIGDYVLWIFIMFSVIRINYFWNEIRYKCIINNYNKVVSCYIFVGFICHNNHC